MIAVAGLVGAVFCLLTVHATSMIYASLRTVRAWANAWTPPVYLVLSLASGAVLANALAHLCGLARTYDGLALAGLVLAAAVKAAYWRSVAAGVSASTPESATGLGALGRVRLLDPPHTGSNYLMREMGFRIARKHAARLRRVVLVAGFVLPAALTLATMALSGVAAGAAALVAALSAVLGLVVERWLFFAEATHVVTLYYGAESA